MRTTVVIQDRSRLYREGVRLLVEAASTIEVVGVVPDELPLFATLGAELVTSVLFEATAVTWNVSRMVKQMREMHAHLILVGTYPNENRRHIALEGITYVRRSSPCWLFVEALTGEGLSSVIEPRSRSRLPESDSLTQRELQVLALISRGLTTNQIGERLGISAKTVENRRQKIFAKLGVQNQSHAVAVAMRTGLLGVGSVGPDPHD